MDIVSVKVEWQPFYGRRPEVYVTIKDSWPPLEAFKFWKHEIDENKTAYCGKAGDFVSYFYHDRTFLSDWYEKPLVLNMVNGIVSLVCGPWRWHAKEMNQYFEPAMDVYFTTADMDTIYRSVTLAGAKQIAKEGGFDLAFVSRKVFGVADQQVTIEPMTKDQPITGAYKNRTWEKIIID